MRPAKSEGMRGRKPKELLIGLAPVCGPNEAHPETGKTWRDMPGSGNDAKRMAFFFHRRGMNPEGYFNNLPARRVSTMTRPRPPKGPQRVLLDGLETDLSFNGNSMWILGNPVSFRLSGETDWQQAELISLDPIELESRWKEKG